jgi:hypothetical protein
LLSFPNLGYTSTFASFINLAHSTLQLGGSFFKTIFHPSSLPIFI